jgi:hypothetical protein
MKKIAPYAKALIGAVVAGLASAQQALDDGVISSAEGVGIAAAVFAGLVLVFSVPNRDPEAEHQDESVQPAPQQILGKAFTGGTFSEAEEDARRNGDPHRP